MTSHDIVVLYASQTGNAEGEAEFLTQQQTQANLKVKSSSMDQYPIEDLPNEKFIIFMVSTTGQGDPPDNMKNFWNFLLIKTLPSDSLSEANFALFGFGDTKYEFYNAPARKLYQRLLQLGANTFCERGLGDDQDNGGYLNSLLAWKNLLFDKIEGIFPIFQKDRIKADQLWEACSPIYNIKKHKSEKSSNGFEWYDNNGETDGSLRFIEDTMLPFLKNDKSIPAEIQICKLSNSQRETSEDHWQNVMNLTFDIMDSTGNNDQYQPGDIACIYPKNSEEDVEIMLKYFELSADTLLEIELKPEYEHQTNKALPNLIKAWDLFEWVLDLKKPPKFFFFKLLMFYTQDETHKERLDEIDFDDYWSYCVKEKRKISEILFDFDTVKLPLEIFLQFIGFIKPREYSIASSLKLHPNQFKLLVASVEYETPFKRQIKGQCSQFFEEAKISSKLAFYIKKGLLQLPENINDPIMVIGPGTGIAPFIAFIEERKCLIEGNPELKSSASAKNYVFFGNRNRDKDFLRKDLLEDLHGDGYINLFKAFSREQDEKYYVQHVLSEQAKRFGPFLKNNLERVRIYVAGRSGFMPKGVERSQLECIKVWEKDDEKCVEIYARLKNNKQIVFETWE